MCNDIFLLKVIVNSNKKIKQNNENKWLDIGKNPEKLIKYHLSGFSSPIYPGIKHCSIQVLDQFIRKPSYKCMPPGFLTASNMSFSASWCDILWNVM